MADPKQDEQLPATPPSATPPSGRASYAAPKLRVFGEVGALTQGGSVGMGEFNMMTMMCRVDSTNASDMC